MISRPFYISLRKLLFWQDRVLHSIFQKNKNAVKGTRFLFSEQYLFELRGIVLIKFWKMLQWFRRMRIIDKKRGNVCS